MIRKIGCVVMLFYVLIGVAHFVREIISLQYQASFWQIYLGSFAVVYGVFAGTDGFVKSNVSKYYRPEMDDKHPEVQKAAIKKLEGN